MTPADPLRPVSGFVAPDVAAEFPGLRLDWVIVPGAPRRSPPSLVAQLGRLAGRVRGASVVTMRTKPIPHAYRAFYRQIGLDPDIDRIPSERAALLRLLHGGFRSVDLITDACLVALLETGVPVWAIDADQIDEHGLGIRITTVSDARRPGGDGQVAPGNLAVADGRLGPGNLAVADGSCVHALLFGEPAAGDVVRRRTRRVALFAVAVPGVPAISVEEALWLCAGVIGNDQGQC